MKKKILQLTVVTAMITGLVACNGAADTDATDNDTLNRMDNTRVDVDTIARMQNKDAEWVSEVLESNYAEIKMAQQAQQKATNPKIKSLAQTLEKDHTTLVNESKDLASRKNWTVATQETANARDDMEDMADDDVKEYERKWLEMMDDKHEKSIRKFENANVNDAELKTWITNTLPKLQAHHDKIEEVQNTRK